MAAATRISVPASDAAANVAPVASNSSSGWGATSTIGPTGGQTAGADRPSTSPSHSGAVRPATGSIGSWLQVRAVGNVASNRAAIGATVDDPNAKRYLMTASDFMPGPTQPRGVQPAVDAAPVDQLVVRPGLGDQAGVKHQH